MTSLSIKTLQHYMFTNKHIMNILSSELQSSQKKEVESKKDSKNVRKKERKEEYILPIHTDTIFWCFYIIMNGLFEYETLGNQTFKEEKDIKIELVSELRNNKELLKKNKWKRNIIENELVNEKKISIQSFLCISAIKKINVILVKGRCVYVQENSPGSDFEIIVECDHGFMLSQHNKEDKKNLINNYYVDYLIIDNVNKPLQAIGNYKVGPLREMCNKLNIPIVTDKGKKYNKKQLYDIIKSKI